MFVFLLVLVLVLVHNPASEKGIIYIFYIVSVEKSCLTLLNFVPRLEESGTSKLVGNSSLGCFSLAENHTTAARK